MNQSMLFRRLKKTSIRSKIDKQNSKWLKRRDSWKTFGQRLCGRKSLSPKSLWFTTIVCRISSMVDRKQWNQRHNGYKRGLLDTVIGIDKVQDHYEAGTMACKMRQRFREELMTILNSNN